jgi:hypothetical protein
VGDPVRYQKNGCEQTADLNDKHYRIPHHCARIELGERVNSRATKDVPIKK